MAIDILFLHSMSTLMCFILFLLLPLLIGILIGWLLLQSRLSKTQAELSDTSSRLDQTRKDLNDRNVELSTLRHQYDELEKELNKTKTALGSARGEVSVLKSKLEAQEEGSSEEKEEGSRSFAAPEAPAADIIYDDLFTADNLQVIEGIGPKIEELLKGAGVSDWGALAQKSEQELRDILHEAGRSFQMHNPKSWPRQAELAREGKWEELLDYQKFLDEGREGVVSMETPAKIENLAIKMLGFPNNPIDLKVVEGIGPRTERVLKEGGISNWSELANADPEQLRQIVHKDEKLRLLNPNTWPRQAKLALEGKWSELKAYQDYLIGGVDPAERGGDG